jgi:uncharacterized ion transporter superfamily protein YfcC
MTIKLPHPFVLLLSAIALAVALTWILPSGRYERRTDPITGRVTVVAGTYARVAQTPVGLVAAMTAAPRGIVAGADVILTILLVGGAVALLDATGALARLVGAIVGRATHPRLVVVCVSVGFATLGALVNLHEEITALIPIVLVLSRRLGFGAVTALAMTIGAAVIGSAFGPTNPFQTGLALRVAELPSVSQPWLRFGLLGAAVSVWIAWTIAMTSRDDVRPAVPAFSPEPVRARDAWLVGIVLAPFVPYVYGVLRLDWGFNELSGLFLAAGFVVGLASGRTLSDTATDLLAAMQTLLAPALFVGLARGISVTLVDGQILDTILHALATPLEQLPGLAAALLMVPVHALLHVPVVSVSGQAVLTMPVMAPLADLVGVSRDAAVIAYQTGAGLMDMLTPTNGALLAMLLRAEVPYGRWLRFAVPGALLVSVVGLAGIWLAAS